MEKIEIQIARKFHKVYEKLAPEFGYTTRPETREFDENSSNGKLMIAVCKEVVLEELDKAREEGREEFTKDELFMLKLATNDIHNKGNGAYDEIGKKIERMLSKLNKKK